MNYCVYAHEVVQCHLRNDFCCSWWLLVFVVTCVFGYTYSALYVTFRTSFISTVTIKMLSFHDPTASFNGGKSWERN
jgi:hypothetical protein